MLVFRGVTGNHHFQLANVKCSAGICQLICQHGEFNLVGSIFSPETLMLRPFAHHLVRNMVIPHPNHNSFPVSVLNKYIYPDV